MRRKERQLREYSIPFVFCSLAVDLLELLLPHSDKAAPELDGKAVASVAGLRGVYACKPGVEPAVEPGAVIRCA